MKSRVIDILLVEDNPGDARLVQIVLSEARDIQFNVVHVERLAQAIDVIKQRSFDAVLLDLSLPDSHGLETVIKIEAVSPNVAIVVLSGFHDEELALQAVKTGAQDYLVKGQADGNLVTRSISYAMERKRIEVDLQKARSELEHRVEERTAHLAESNRRLQQEITQRMSTEEVLRKQRDYTSAVLDIVSALVVVLDNKGRIVSFNRACEKTTGYNFDEVRGKTVWDLFVPPEEVDAVKNVFYKLFITQHLNHFENHWLIRSGEKRLLAWNAVVLKRQGPVDYIIGTGIDITEQRRAEELERQRMLELAHVSRLSTMGEMATEIAHELNQPLTAIASYSDTCIRLMNSLNFQSADLHEALSEIAGQSERAGEMIRRLRSFARKETPEQLPLDINALVQGMVRLTNVEARWNHVEFVLNLGDSLPQVAADKVLIEQVIINLIRNAIDAMGDHQCETRRLTIRSIVNKQDFLEVSIEDTGPGLSYDVLTKIFQPFYTTKSTGMGMGLSLSQSIIEAHGGKIWAANNEGNGAIFRFTLPLLTN